MRQFAANALYGLIITVCLMASHVSAAEPAIGKIVRVKQGAFINGQPAIRMGHIVSGDTITTDADGRVEISFIDTTVLTVGGASEFTIDEYSYSTTNSVQKALLILTQGAFRAVTSQLIDAAPENFQIATPLATIGIRGTDFWGGFLTADTLDVLMLDGKGVVVTTEGGTLVIDKPGYGLTVPTQELPPQNLKKWGPAKVGEAVQTVSFE